MEADRYAARGVSSGKEEVHAAIGRLDKGLYSDTFCKILPDYAAGDDVWCNLLHADTAGTKTALAYLYWRETGDLSVWESIVQDALVMNLDDMAAAGCMGPFTISSTIGRNKGLISGDVLKALIEGTASFIDSLAEMGVQLYHAGGETADVGDIVRTVDVGFTVFSRMPRASVQHIQIKPGAVIVGLAAYGQTVYETQYNSGIGSNGLTFARHEVLKAEYGRKYPESFDPKLKPEVVYQGRCEVQDPVEGTPLNVGKLLLSPTRTYLPFLKAIPHSLRKYIQGIIHCTGGGQTKVLHFVEGVEIIKDNLLPIPPVFHLIQQQNKVAWRELFRVFNMGHRMELYVDALIAEELLQLAQGLHIDAQVIGRVNQFSGGGKQLTLHNPDNGEIYTYT